MHIFLFFIFLPFIFLFFLLYIFLTGRGPARPRKKKIGGWAQRSPHGLGWTQPAQPGHWPKPVTRLGKN
jgi:hypothetical protein